MTYCPSIDELNQRAQDVLRHVVDLYVESGTPVGSKLLAERLNSRLSPATIRNVMAELQGAGLLHSPHTSAGRIPTEAGLRIFVDALLDLGHLSQQEQKDIEVQCQATGRNIKQMLGEASRVLSGLSQCAAMVIAPKAEDPLKHIEFVQISPQQALVILVSQNGAVENRLIHLPAGMPPSALQEASNYLNSRLAGRTMAEVRHDIMAELKHRRAQLDTLASQLVKEGLAVWNQPDGESQLGTLIVHGHANLLENVSQMADLKRVRQLMETLEAQQNWLSLLEEAKQGEGVRIFIGAENELFSLTGCSLVVAPFTNSQKRVVGALGVVGPTRLNYGRVIPMVDYTAKVISKLLG